MTQSANKPSTTAQRTTRKNQASSNDDSKLREQTSPDAQDVQDRDSDRDDRNERDERSERDADKRHERDSRREQDRAGDRDDRDERDSSDDRRGVQRTLGNASDRDLLERSRDAVTPAAANPFEAFGPMFDVTTVFRTMSEFTTGMLKLQQEAFASLLGGTNAGGQNTPDAHDDTHDDRTHRQNLSRSRTSSSASERHQDDRR